MLEWNDAASAAVFLFARPVRYSGAVDASYTGDFGGTA